MNLGTLLFGFQGRINRAKFWLAVLIYFVAWMVAIGFVFAWGFTGPAIAALVIIGIPIIVSGIAVGIKRLHDRDKSGWWLLFFYLVPGVLDGIGQGLGRDGIGIIFTLGSLAISIWAFVLLGCLRGTTGPNKFGPDPLQES